LADFSETGVAASSATTQALLLFFFFITLGLEMSDTIIYEP